MESVSVMTGKQPYQDMIKFLGKLFGINFALGDIFGAPLAIEGLMAFLPAPTFIGLSFFGWNRLILHPLGGWLLMGLGYLIRWRASHD